jgi:hypothetical protein
MHIVGGSLYKPMGWATTWGFIGNQYSGHLPHLENISSQTDTTGNAQTNWEKAFIQCTSRIQTGFYILLEFVRNDPLKSKRLPSLFPVAAFRYMYSATPLTFSFPVCERRCRHNEGLIWRIFRPICSLPSIYFPAQCRRVRVLARCQRFVPVLNPISDEELRGDSKRNHWLRQGKDIKCCRY